MRRCAVISGADIGNYEIIRAYLRPDDFIICCDSGLRHQDGLGVTADLIIGDFDSHENPHLSTETIVLPREKYDTDTMAAVREADARGFTDFLLLGVFGNRMDHTLANLYILIWLPEQGQTALAVDDYSEITLVTPERPGRVEDTFPYFSLLNITGTARGIRITNAAWPLDGAEITPDYQYGVSNEPLPGKTAEISLKAGALLLIKDRA